MKHPARRLNENGLTAFGSYFSDLKNDPKKAPPHHILKDERYSEAIDPHIELEDTDFRVRIGGKDCKQPYSASLLNISAMSFGSLSGNAIEALNTGAKAGGFAHDTGEGSVSRYHKAGGGDLIYQVASGYFGARSADGSFDEYVDVQYRHHVGIATCGTCDTVRLRGSAFTNSTTTRRSVRRKYRWPGHTYSVISQYAPFERF